MNKLKLNHIYHGNCLDILKTLPSKSIDCIVTSPPYFRQRGYNTIPQIWGGNKDCDHEWNDTVIKGTSGGIDSKKVQIKGQSNFQITKDTKYSKCNKCEAELFELGQSPTIESYINPLCNIFDEAKRVLTDYGTLWVNLGDKNNSSGGAGSQGSKYRNRHTQFGKKVVGESQSIPTQIDGIPKQSRMMIPERFAIEMINRGWILKNDIILNKKNCMPQSSPMKFTDNYEHFYFFVKNNTPLYYVNKKTNQIQKEKPKGVNGIEGIDWFINKNNRKQSHWRSYPYYFKQQFEP
jgi:DNA modification methylase